MTTLSRFGPSVARSIMYRHSRHMASAATAPDLVQKLFADKVREFSSSKKGLDETNQTVITNDVARMKRVYNIGELGKLSILATQISPGADVSTADTEASKAPKQSITLEELQKQFDLQEVPISDLGLGHSDISGAIVPLAEQYFLQKLFFAYGYPIMYFMDYLLTVMPFWSVILTTTLLYKLLFFPFMVKQQIITVKSLNISPETQKIQQKMNEAMASGNAYEQSLQRFKLSQLYTEHNLGLKQRLMPILVQMPGQVCLFLLLKKLADVQSDALVNGGVLWFTNLCIPDPYYILPFVASATTYLMMDINSPTKLMTPGMKWAMRIFPCGIFLFMMNFPASVGLFWATNSMFVLLCNYLFSKPAVAKIFNIPEKIKHDPSVLPLTNQTFKQQMNTAVQQGRARKTTLDIRRLDDIAFKKAAVGPLRKTYSVDPTNNKVR